MIEVLWHGRGGQGAFTAARLLGAATSFQEGRYALAFPSFGPERRGAPIRAFTKFGNTPINDRSAITCADFAIYLDDTLLGDTFATELKPNGTVLVNSTCTFDDPRIVSIDADGISQAVLGRPIPNTALLGALSALCEAVRLADLKEAIHQYMPAKLHEANLRIVDMASERMRADGSKGTGAAPASTSDARGEDGCSPHTHVSTPLHTQARNGIRIPTLRCNPALDPNHYAHSTCFTAGHLVSTNAGWRNVRPMVDASACTRCGTCIAQCPDGTLYLTCPDESGENSMLVVDLDFCKGCGICARACPLGAVTMVAEQEAAR